MYLQFHSVKEPNKKVTFGFGFFNWSLLFGWVLEHFLLSCSVRFLAKQKFWFGSFLLHGFAFFPISSKKLEKRLVFCAKHKVCIAGCAAGSPDTAYYASLIAKHDTTRTTPKALQGKARKRHHSESLQNVHDMRTNDVDESTRNLAGHFHRSHRLKPFIDICTSARNGGVFVVLRGWNKSVLWSHLIRFSVNELFQAVMLTKPAPSRPRPRSRPWPQGQGHGPKAKASYAQGQGHGIKAKAMTSRPKQNE